MNLWSTFGDQELLGPDFGNKLGNYLVKVKDALCIKKSSVFKSNQTQEIPHLSYEQFIACLDIYADSENIKQAVSSLSLSGYSEQAVKVADDRFPTRFHLNLLRLGYLPSPELLCAPPSNIMDHVSNMHLENLFMTTAFPTTGLNPLVPTVCMLDLLIDIITELLLLDEEAKEELAENADELKLKLLLQEEQIEKAEETVELLEKMSSRICHSVTSRCSGLVAAGKKLGRGEEGEQEENADNEDDDEDEGNHSKYETALGIFTEALTGEDEDDGEEEEDPDRSSSTLSSSWLPHYLKAQLLTDM